MFLIGRWYKQDKTMIWFGRLLKKPGCHEFYIELKLITIVSKNVFILY